MAKNFFDEKDVLEDSFFDEADIEIETPDVSQLEAAIRGGAQGLTFDFADEIMAGGKAITEDMLAAITGKDAEISPRVQRDKEGRITNLEELKGNYDKYLAEERAADLAAREAHPGTYYGTGVTAGIIPALLTGGATAAGKIGTGLVKEGVKSATMREGMKQAAKVGAGYGALSGAGVSEAETPQELLGDIATGTAMGAGLGVAMPVVGKAASKGIEKVGKMGGALLDMAPSLRAGWDFGKKYGYATYEKVQNLMEKNTRGLIDDINKSFNKLGNEGKELSEKFNVTKDIRIALEEIREKAKYAATEADAKKYNSVADEIESFMLKEDKNLKKLIRDTEREIAKKEQAAANRAAAATGKAEGKAVLEAEKSGAKLETFTDVDKPYTEVADLPFENIGGRIKGGRAKFKDEYINLEGQPETYEFTKPFLSDVSQPKFSPIKAGMKDGKVFTEYIDEASGQVFRKELPASQMSSINFENVAVDELLEVISGLGNKVFDGNASSVEVDAYKSVWKALRSKVPELGEGLPKSKQEMFKLFQIMNMLGVDKAKLKRPSVEDITKLMKQLPSKMDEERYMVDKYLTEKGSPISEKLQNVDLISEAEKYLTGQRGSGTSEFSRAGILQRIGSKGINIAGATARRVKQPVSKVANKVNDLTDRSLTLINKKMAESNSTGIQKLGQQLDYALQQEGPVKSALVWSLSQNPAFRKFTQETLMGADEGLREEWGLPTQRIIEKEGNADEAFGEDMYESENGSIPARPVDQLEEPSRVPAGMAEENEVILNHIVSDQIEGGYQNMQTDKGNYLDGKNIGTNRGITPKAYKEYYGKAPSVEDMKNLTKEQAKEIYISDYIKKPKLDLIKDPAIRYAVVDFGINSGPATAIKQLQRVVGAGVDGKMGPNTIAAIENYEGDLVEDLTEARKNFVMSSKRINEGLKQGIINRIERSKDFTKEVKGRADLDTEINDSVRKMEVDVYNNGDLEESIEDAKKAIDRQAKQIGSGDMTPVDHIDTTLGAIEALPIGENEKDALQDEAAKMETYRDAERLKALLDGLKMS